MELAWSFGVGFNEQISSTGYRCSKGMQIGGRTRKYCLLPSVRKDHMSNDHNTWNNALSSSLSPSLTLLQRLSLQGSEVTGDKWAWISCESTVQPNEVNSVEGRPTVIYTNTGPNVVWSTERINQHSSRKEQLLRWEIYAYIRVLLSWRSRTSCWLAGFRSNKRRMARTRKMSRRFRFGKANNGTISASFQHHHHTVWFTGRWASVE